MRKSLLDLKLSWARLNWKTLYDLARALCKDEEKVERPASDMQQHAVVFQESKHWETAGTAQRRWTQPCDCRLARGVKRSAPCAETDELRRRAP